MAFLVYFDIDRYTYHGLVLISQQLITNIQLRLGVPGVVLSIVYDLARRNRFLPRAPEWFCYVVVVENQKTKNLKNYSRGAWAFRVRLPGSSSQRVDSWLSTELCILLMSMELLDLRLPIMPDANSRHYIWSFPLCARGANFCTMWEVCPENIVAVRDKCPMSLLIWQLSLVPLQMTL